MEHADCVWAKERVAELRPITHNNAMRVYDLFKTDNGHSLWRQAIALPEDDNMYHVPLAVLQNDEKNELNDAGLVGQLLRELPESENQTRNSILAFMCALACPSRDNPIKNSLISLIQPLLDLLPGKLQSAEQAALVLAVFSHICFDSGRNAKALREANGHTLIREVMKQYPEHVETQYYGVSCIHALARMNLNSSNWLRETYDNIKNAMQQFKGLRCIQSVCCNAIRELSFESNENRNYLQDNGAMELVMQALYDLPDSKYVHRYGCASIRNLAWQNARNQLLLAQGGAPECMARSINLFLPSNGNGGEPSGDDIVVEEATAAIWNINIHADALVHMTNEITEAMTDAACACQEQEKTIFHCFGGLRILLNGDGKVLVFLERKGGQAISDAMKRHISARAVLEVFKVFKTVMEKQPDSVSRLVTEHSILKSLSAYIGTNCGPQLDSLKAIMRSWESNQDYLNSAIEDGWIPALLSSIAKESHTDFCATLLVDLCFNHKANREYVQAKGGAKALQTAAKIGDAELEEKAKKIMQRMRATIPNV